MPVAVLKDEIQDLTHRVARDERMVAELGEVADVRRRSGGGRWHSVARTIEAAPRMGTGLQRWHA